MVRKNKKHLNITNTIVFDDFEPEVNITDVVVPDQKIRSRYRASMGLSSATATFLITDSGGIVNGETFVLTDLIAAPGSGKVINIINVQTFADIADPTQQLQTNSRANMHVGYDNSGNPFQLGTSTVLYARRFMYNVPSSALVQFFPSQTRSGTLPANTKVVISGEDRQAFPNNCFTDVDVYITYQIIDA